MNRRPTDCRGNSLAWTLLLALLTLVVPTLRPAAAQPPTPTSTKPQAATAPAPGQGPAATNPNVQTAQALAAAATEEPPARLTAQTAHLVLKVIHPVEARGALIREAHTLGGFPTLVTDERLRLKLPPAALSAFLKRAGAEGLVMEKGIEQVDLTEETSQLQGRIRSKQEIFGKLRTFFDSSSVEATLQIETTMTALVQELEQLKGQLRVQQERALWAEVELAFSLPPRRSIVYVQSPFGWLNSLDLDRFLGDF